MVRRPETLEALMDRLVAGRSFVDVGAMWGIHGRSSFMAEEHGATAVTALDIIEETPEYLAEHERRGSKVRFVRGDLHDDAALDEVGRHDIVWCSGVLYHVPNPVTTLECLRRLTGETLILTAVTIPEFPGIEHGAVFFPALPERARRAYDRAYDATLAPGPRVGLSVPFAIEHGYSNWWWGLTPSAVGSLLSVTGFRVDEVETSGFRTRFVARPT